MNTTISTPGQLVVAVTKTLGFYPHDSMVVVPTGYYAPFARLDLPVSTPWEKAPSEMEKAFRPAATHWSKVAVLFFTNNHGLVDFLVDSYDTLLPTANVQVTLQVSDGEVFFPSDRLHVWRVPLETGFPELDASRVLSSRDELVAEAAKVTDLEEAEQLAVAAFKVGRGAHSQVFLDRAVELNSGEHTAVTSMLRDLLANAVSPKIEQE